MRRRRSSRNSVKLKVESLAEGIRVTDEFRQSIIFPLDIKNTVTTLGNRMTLFQRSNGRWYVRFWLNGQRRMLSTGETDYDKALMTVKEIIEGAANPTRSMQSPPITFFQLADEFERYIEKRWMPKTVENDKSRLRGLRAVFGKKNVSDISRQQLMDYLEQRTEKTVVRVKAGKRYEQKINIDTVNRELTSIKLLFKFAVEKGYITENPAEKIKPFPRLPDKDGNIPTGERRPLTKDEWNRLLEASEKSKNELLTFILKIDKYSGLRKGELRRLTWDDVDFDKNVLSVRQTKNKSTIDKPMPRKLRQVLLALRDKYPFAQYVLCKPDGSPCGDWRTSFNNACKRAGLDDVCFHMLRHTCFSNLGNHGYGPFQIKAYSGHKSLKMVQRYTKISPEYVQKMANALDLDDD